MTLKHILASAGICLCTATAAAMDRGAAVALSVEFARLDMDTTMMLYDEHDERVQLALTKRIAAMDPQIATMVAEATPADAEAAARDAENWATIRRAIAGADGSSGMVDSGYDAQAFAEYRTAIGELQRALVVANRLDEGGTPAEQALLLAARIMAVYIRIAGSPFGSYSDNNDDSINDDLGKMSTRLDGLLAALATARADDPAASTTLKGVAMKWRFIRSSILQYTRQSTPTIVYLHGTDVINGLAKLR